MSQILSAIAVIGIDIGKNSFHVVGQDGDGSLLHKWSLLGQPARPRKPINTDEMRFRFTVQFAAILTDDPAMANLAPVAGASHRGLGNDSGSCCGNLSDVADRLV
jgi:hypothetical protein